MPNASMTVKDAFEQLEALGDEKVRAHNTKHGAGGNQFGVRLGDIRALAKKIKSHHELAKALCKTGIVDAQFLAALIIKPNPERRPFAKSGCTSPFAPIWINEMVRRQG